MKKALLALVALLVLGGAAAGAYYYFQTPANASVGETDGHQEAAEAKDSGGGHGSDKAVFVEIDPLVLPIIDESGVSQVVSIVVVIEVPDGDAAKKVENLTPRLKDAYIQEMYGALNKQAALKGGVVQIAMLKELLSKISHRVLGHENVSDVLLQVVQQRRA